MLSGQAETAGTAQIFGAGRSDDPNALLLLLLLLITFMPGIYSYGPEIKFLVYIVLQLFCIYNLCYM